MIPGRWEVRAYAVGWALLYTSAYYLPYADVPHHYWLPHPFREILYPTLVGTLLLIPVAGYLQARYLRSGIRHLPALLGIVVLGLDALGSALSTIGYSALDLAEDWINHAATLGGAKAALITTAVVLAIPIAGCGIVALAALTRQRLALVRLLSTLGYAYAIVALLRMAPFLTGASYSHLHSQPPATAQSPSLSSNRPREVVWIIFDELDYEHALGTSHRASETALPNLQALSHRGVSASDAYSPARDTLISLPSLLLGQIPKGYEVDKTGYSLHTQTGGFIPFDEAHSVFARLPAGPASGALLGFYHPYCTVLPSVSPCTALPLENVGRWFDALLPPSERIAALLRRLPGSQYIPGAVFHALHPMYRISEQTLAQYPSLLQLNDKALVFLHVNLPHYPADYAQRVLHLPRVTSQPNGYEDNLRLVDEITGAVVRTLQEASKTRDVLLIVSSDHWFRVESPTTVRNIPWIAWHVGEDGGPELSQRISTVHTAELALDFLKGNIQSQREIPAWWLNKSYAPPLMPDHYKD